MARGTKRFFGIIVVLILLSMVAGVVVRNSYTGFKNIKELSKVKNINEFRMSCGDNDEELLNSNVKTIDDVANKSDLIVKVKISDEKIIEDADIKTKVKVEKIIKSDGRNIKKGDDIYIYEMIDISKVDDSFMTSAKYNYLDTGKEYYLCLNSLKTIKGYKKSEEEKKTYMYSTNYYSVYSASKEQKVVKLSKKKIYNVEYKYRDLKDQVILTSDKNVVDDYNKMSESFAQKYMD
ncbi:hypothetical protein [Lachnobacterium bovis]|uniref:Uncharacterized protein n=1 Tax=Lachnobacterium bovis DSM 14045 TaxID=1122142 RepID=A0A1H3L414_9FIRM|nr:hypothetical protein [Lachnobacterium bovis]SDY59100.1 hypothetical protein SAMN02910414_01909 [Lachnobacterium bovis DSM 14045]